MYDDGSRISITGTRTTQLAGRYGACEVVIRFALIVLGFTVAGCAPDLAALANDKNSDCLTESSVWVAVTLERNWGCHYPPPGFVLVAAPKPPS